MDFLLAGAELVVSEINTIPGFTPISLFPTLPAAAGYDFAAVCRRVVDLALEREAGRVRAPADGRGPAALMGGRSSMASTRPRPPSVPRARGSGVRRARSVRRRSAGLTPTRAGALLALVVALAGLYGATSSGAFALKRTEVSGVTWTSEDAVLAALAIPDGQNLFTLDTTELSKRLASIPAIRGASITVALPDEVRVDVAERVALLAWQVGADRYLVDEDGMVFGRIDAASPGAAAKLPLVDDQRAAAASHRRGRHARPRHPRRRADGSARCARPTSARPRRGSGSSSTTPRASRSTPTRWAGPRCSGSTRRRCARPT